LRSEDILRDKTGPASEKSTWPLSFASTMGTGMEDHDRVKQNDSEKKPRESEDTYERKRRTERGRGNLRRKMGAKD